MTAWQKVGLGIIAVVITLGSWVVVALVIKWVVA